jgi:hypothetical protein
MSTALKTLALASLLVAGIAGAADAASATLFLNVKVALGDQPARDHIADGFCIAKGYDRAASYEGRLVVESSGYARFAKIRCEKAVAKAAGANVVAVR